MLLLNVFLCGNLKNCASGENTREGGDPGLALYPAEPIRRCLPVRRPSGHGGPLLHRAGPHGRRGRRAPRALSRPSLPALVGRVVLGDCPPRADLRPGRHWERQWGMGWTLPSHATRPGLKPQLPAHRGAAGGGGWLKSMANPRGRPPLSSGPLALACPTLAVVSRRAEASGCLCAFPCAFLPFKDKVCITEV